VTRDVIANLEAEARAAHPRECCGILLGEDARIDAIKPARNIHASPQTHFEIDPQVLVDAHRAARQGGAQVIGFYHSHPAGDPAPSRTDTQMASGDRRIWAIIAQDRIALWRDRPDGFLTLSYTVTDT